MQITEQGEHLYMRVEDDGVFGQHQPIVPGFGLSSMEARCERAGGTMTIEAIHTQGMRLTVCIPYGGIEAAGGDEL